MPSITVGLLFVAKVAVQLAFGTLPCPELPTALTGATLLLPASPIFPGGDPLPLFQWYVSTEVTQYGLPPVLKLGALPPFSRVKPLPLSNNLTIWPLQVYCGVAATCADPAARSGTAETSAPHTASAPTPSRVPHILPVYRCERRPQPSSLTTATA